jgi:hypothetical protein
VLGATLFGVEMDSLEIDTPKPAKPVKAFGKKVEQKLCMVFLLCLLCLSNLFLLPC